MADPPAPLDLAARLRSLTIARVGLGRVGAALPTRPMLDFQLAHARARDAVHAALPIGAIAIAGHAVIDVRSRAVDRTCYLHRPDLGRRLHPDDAALLPAGEPDLAIVVADGLSAVAVERHACALIAALLKRLPHWTVAPIVVARQARVAIGDEIGAALRAKIVVVLIGERPGLSSAESVGAYITWAPARGRRDNERNCVSNIHPPNGLDYANAADEIATLCRAARDAGRTGVLLKDFAGDRLPDAAPPR
ncbi:ethanolamine ammonia-lyase subunit EutC [Sphingomonas prati]|uniref:Ethanolamine ammonia-lyase small subunit n=1 Tax=Sphingomonas prati TaxID=1843237 RepID=A0A7W9BVF6_9SPHN|nr:ethanolamine ammonia-lyase subunit EutC [Sphingomonas prati]MBB5730388.1 ethanolamine ammonia-lyase small subunit [Sphingomonas prati]GGE93715.1 ethanolamine ammonia-lyase light chain [Sphingomonas prati]